jgi:hypothetical protein
MGVESLWNLNLAKGNLIYNGFKNDTSRMVDEARSEDCLYLAIWALLGLQTYTNMEQKSNC